MVIVKGGCVLLVNPVPVYYILIANGPRRTVVLVSLSFNFAPSSPQVKHRPARATSSREEFILHIESTDWMTWLFRLHAPLSPTSPCVRTLTSSTLDQQQQPPSHLIAIIKHSWTHCVPLLGGFCWSCWPEEHHQRGRRPEQPQEDNHRLWMATTEMDFISPRGIKCIVNFKRSDPIYCFFLLARLLCLYLYVGLLSLL